MVPPVAWPEPLVLASQSPRRRALLTEAGYRFEVAPPSDAAECGVCSGEGPAELVARYALQKALDVGQRFERGVIVGCDTVAALDGRIFGKPANEDHARSILQTLRGREHQVYSGLCVWVRPDRSPRVEVDCTVLRMEPLSDAALEEYLASGLWEGKSGAFGYQDRAGWLEIVHGSESNVVGLPMELLERMLGELPE